MRACTFFASVIGMMLLSADATALQQTRIEGRVKDERGAVVIGALVTLVGGNLEQTRTTDGEGRFAFESAPTDGARLEVRARGFESHVIEWRPTDRNNGSLEIVLAPATISDEITVTATRTETRLSDSAASVVLLTPSDLKATAAVTLDDALRQIPGFSLFRRAGSRTANPTAQGVSLRGVGASGASRALMLADGIPLNDPFGGWVYWGRVPRESIGRIEVVRGGGSHLYGTDALGGVISLLPRRENDSTFSMEASYGNQRTPSGSLFANGRVGLWSAQVSAQAFNTDGYVIVAEEERGRVDTPAGAEYSALEVALERSLAGNGRVFARGSIFGEDRENGTPLQTNQTYIRQLAVGADWTSPRVGTLSIRSYGGTQMFDQDFSAVAADRNSETITRSQRVPAQQIGVGFQWSRAAGSRQTLVGGLDAREVRGASDELGFVAGRLSSAVGSGGRQRTLGIFGEDIIRITPRLLATVAARIDRWRNYDALSVTRPLAQPGPSTSTLFPDRTETAFSPHLSLVQHLSDSVSISGSVYRAFRAPTLNELYRGFRVGNVLTLANEDLRAERLTGAEASTLVRAARARLNLRGTFFWSAITRPIANVTLRVTPDLITRQRQNLGRTQSRGIELEAEARVLDQVSISGGYLFVDATVISFPANTQLEGLLIPQVARHQFTFQVKYSGGRNTVGLQGRTIGSQFDDDQNRFRLGRFFTLDALASRALTQGVEIFAAAENLFDQRYDVGRTPIRTVGPPILARVGLRLRWGAR